MPAHTLQLATEPFAAIAAGRKTIESRLYDEKRQQIALGDQIIFVNREQPGQQIAVLVTGLLRYASFRELYATVPASFFGRESAVAALAQVRNFYSEADEQHNGILGIQFVLADRH